MGYIISIATPATSPGALTLPYDLEYTATSYADGTPVHRSSFNIHCDAGGASITITNTSLVGGSSSGPTGPAAPVPGADMVPIPDYAVVGTFTTSTPLYFQPEASSASTYSMEAGQSLWVFGLDESGEFYQGC
jgi:hypothetical protein